jgi:hypothetical protein
VEAKVLTAFGACADPSLLVDGLGEPPDPSKLPDYHLSAGDLRQQIATVLRAAAMLQRNLRVMESHRLPLVGLVESDCPDAAEAVMSHALSVQDATNAAVQRRRAAWVKKSPLGGQIAGLAAMTDRQYAESQRFAVGASIDLREESAGFPAALNSDVPPGIVAAVAAQADPYAFYGVTEDDLRLKDDGLDVLLPGETLPTPEQIAARAAEVRKHPWQVANDKLFGQRKAAS